MNEGPLGELPFILKPLEAYQDSMTVISGLDATSSMPATGETGGDHSRSAAVFSGVPPKKTVSADIHLGVTIDQIIAQKLGQDTALPSLQLGLRGSEFAGDVPLGLQLRVCELGFVGGAGQAASARSQSAGRVRAPVRRREQPAAAPGAQADAIQPARCGQAGSGPPERHASRNRPHAAERVPRGHSRDRAPPAERGEIHGHLAKR